MATKNEYPDVAAAAARYERAKTRYEEARDELRDAALTELANGARWADIARASGWDREYLRRLKNKHDEELAANAKLRVDPAPAELGINPLVNQLSRGRLAQLDEWLRERRADWYSEKLPPILATVHERWHQYVAVSEGAAAGHIPEDMLRG